LEAIVIINLRGTSGSGKSHIVREIMASVGGKDAFVRIKEDGRKQPLGYLSPPYTSWAPQNGNIHSGQLFIPGHYETACGGCDTIHGNDRIFELVRMAAGEGHDVLFEGLILSVEFNRTLALWTDRFPLKVMAVNIPLDQCLESIMTRRRIKNPDAKDVNPYNTTNKHKQTIRSMERLQQAGVDTFIGDRAQVLAKVKEVLHVS
jgi:hypothetical protein